MEPESSLPYSQLNIIITKNITSKNKLKVDSSGMCGDSSLKVVFISSTRILGVQSQKMVLFRNTSCQTARHIPENCSFARPHDVSPQKMLFFRKGFQLATRLPTVSCTCYNFQALLSLKVIVWNGCGMKRSGVIFLNSPSEYFGD